MALSHRLDASGVTVRFGSTVALDAVDLHVAAGEVVAVLGPSGSGKSTLLRAVAGLQALAAGSVAIDGSDLAGVPPHRRGVGLMFQDQALFPHRDVAGNVGFGLRMQGRPRAVVADRVRELLDTVGLAGMGAREVTSLSGGEQQRVALARALAPEPRLLLLDEPLGALDRALRDRLVDELRDLFTRLALTVVAVTHDQREAYALADRLVVLHGGRVLRSGSPSEVWHDPQAPEVARALGFANVVDAAAEGGVVRTPWGVVPSGATAEGPVTVVVRPTAVHIRPEGSVPATVTSCTFAGTSTRLRLGVDGGPPLEAEVATAGAPASGDSVRFDLDPAGVSILAR